MAIASALTSPDSIPAMIAAAAAILGGVTSLFKILLVPQKDFRDRVNLKREALQEKLIMRLVALLQHVRRDCLTSPQDAPLRGNGREQPDLVREYSEENLRVFDVYQKLGTLYKIVKYSYLWLFITAIAGLAGLSCAFFAPGSGPWVLRISGLILGTQIVTIVVVRLSEGKLDEYEDVT